MRVLLLIGVVATLAAARPVRVRPGMPVKRPGMPVKPTKPTKPVVPSKPKICCRAMTKECLACAAGVSVKDFCAKNAGKFGCPKPTPACCKALTKECLACARGLSVREFCAKYPGKFGCPSTKETEHAKAVKAHLEAQEKAQKAVATEKAKKAAITSAEKAKKSAAAEKEAKAIDLKRSPTNYVRQDAPGSKKYNEAGKPTVITGSQGEHDSPKYGDVSGMHCQKITGRRTDKDGVLHLGTDLNPQAEAHTCSGKLGKSGGKTVCCPKRCGSCDDSARNCKARGGSLCCAKQVLASQRVCSKVVTPPCEARKSLDRSIRIEKVFASAFTAATRVCFHPYGFYCQKITKKFKDPKFFLFATALNDVSHGIVLPKDAAHALSMEDLARICFVPDPLAPEQQSLKGTYYRHRDDFDSKVAREWREKYGIVHPQQGTGYARENDERWNTWPAYKKYLPKSGCCRTCSTGIPCGKSCISKDKKCHKVPGVHEWCACDKDTSEKLALIKKYPSNVSAPKDWQGWPYTYPKTYKKDAPWHHAKSWKGFDSYDKHGDGKITAKFDKRGRMIPEKKIEYSPSKTRACCRMACATRHANHADALQDCVEGCDLWIAKSSLNWDAKKWWPMLETKCSNDCTNIAAWKIRESVRGHTCPSNKKCTTYYHSLRTPSDENKCKSGCSMFHKCMQNGGNAQKAAAIAPVSTQSEMRAAAADSNMCRVGWGVLSKANPFAPKEPRVCCHYSCGRCITNCNGAMHGTQGLFNADKQRSDSLRFDRCCVSRIMQSGRFCDSHKAPCIVPPVPAYSN